MGIWKMNERIKELALQAEKLSLQYANKNNVNHIDAFNTVFAELIVRECADYISETATIETLLGERLKEHFGVEE
jgi:hypothetical protein